MSKIEIINSIPLGAERVFACPNMRIESLAEFNENVIKFIYELQSDEKILIIGEPRRENSTGHSFISYIYVRRIG